MFSYECVLAAVLVTAPPESLTADDLHGWFEPLQATVVSVAVEAEVLDGREIKFLVAGAAEFASDLKILQHRFQDLAGAPYLEECRRFPERPVVGEFLSFNRAYRHDLTAQLALDPIHADELRLSVAETDQLHHIWDTLRDARCEYYYITVRRQALQALRDLIGAENFYRGQLPPHVPVWRFSQSN